MSNEAAPRNHAAGVLGPKRLIRLEAAALLAAAVVLHAVSGAGWLWFLLFLILPDLGIAAYGLGPRLGAAVYNLFHFSLFAVALALYGIVADAGIALSIGCGWGAHIALDRTVGYGLKYPDRFKHTHLQNL